MRYRVGIKTRDRILESTRQLVADSGLEGTTIKGICDRAGILAGSFYNLFSSKEEAVLAVVSDAIQQVEPDPDAPADIRSLVDAYVRFIDEQEPVARVYMEVAVARSVRDEKLRARVMRHHETRIELFSAALDDAGIVEAAAMAELMVAALNGLALHRLLDPGFDLRGQAERLLSLRPVPTR